MLFLQGSPIRHSFKQSKGLGYGRVARSVGLGGYASLGGPPSPANPPPPTNLPWPGPPPTLFRHRPRGGGIPGKPYKPVENCNSRRRISPWNEKSRGNSWKPNKTCRKWTETDISGPSQGADPDFEGGGSGGLSGGDPPYRLIHLCIVS